MRSQRATLLLVVLISGVFYLALLPNIFRHLNPVTGDEPFYIMTAISMVRDRDIDESNNYESRDYQEFYPETPLPGDWQGWPAFPSTLPPHPAITERDGLFTKHGLGLSMLIAIPYEIMGRLGAVLVVVACAAALAGQMYLFGRESGNPESASLAAALALAISMPIAPYAMLIFPEVPAALLIIYAVRRLAAGTNTTSQWILTGAATGFLPWLHQRFAVVSIVLGCLILIELWKSRSRSVGLAVVPVVLGALTIIGYNMWLYGQPTQNTADHAGFSNLAGTLNGAAGLFLDAQWGLLVAAPVALIALAAVPVWAFRAPRIARICAISVAPYLVVVAAYQVWWGEWGPPARYLVPVVPLLAGPLACWLAQATRNQLAVAFVAWLAGMTLTVVGFVQPQRFYHHPDGINNLYTVVGERTGVDLAQYLVPFQFYSPDPAMVRVLTSLAAISVLLLLVAWFLLTAKADTAGTTATDHD